MCAESHRPDVTGLSSTYLRDKIRATVKYENPDYDWHTPNNNFLVYINISDYACNVLADRGELENIRVRYHLYPDQSQELYDHCKVDDGTWVCTEWSGPWYNYGQGHTEANVARIYVDKRTMDEDDGNGQNSTTGIATRRYILSHETGHAFGLSDPNFYGDCRGSSGGTSTNSVMHSRDYGCDTSYQFPRYSDRQSVNHISDPSYYSPEPSAGQEGAP